MADEVVFVVGIRGRSICSYPAAVISLRSEGWSEMSILKPQRRSCAHKIRMALGVAGILSPVLLAGSARADQSLFTTLDDWSQWSAPAGPLTLTPGAASDIDLTPTNGLGNTSAPQQPGTAGGLGVAIAGTPVYASFLSPGEQANAPFLAALSSAPTVQVDFTLPSGGGTYFDPQLLLNYTGNYLPIDPTSVTNPGAYWTATYTLPTNLPAAPSAGLSYFQVGFIANTDETGSFTIDNLIAQAPPNVTTIFTTNSDWGQWTSGSTGISVSATATGDTDGNPTTSLGNTLYGPGQRDLSGGLTVNIAPGPPSQQYGSVLSPDEHNNAPLLAALAAALELKMDFTYPVFNGTYFQPLLLLNFDGNYDQIAPSSILNLGTYSTAIYTLPAGLPTDPGSLSYFQIGVIASTDETGNFTIDNMELISAVPEPAAVSLLAIAVGGVILRRNRPSNTGANL
jgi:hypothetical protein